MPMKDFYIYILQVNAGLAVFYLLYRVLTVKDTFFGVRRFFLLSVLLLAFAYPLVPLAEWLKDKQPLQAIIVDYSEFIVQVAALPEISPEEKTFFTTENVLSVVWFCGITFFFFRFLVQLGAIFRLRLSGEVGFLADTRVIVLKNDTAPFSFFGWIFLDPRCYTAKELQGILIHEKAHVKQGHTWDMLAGEMLCLFFWFNPCVWLIRREIRQNLEFLADRGVISSGFDRKDYQYHLLRISNPSVATQIINNFNVSPLKKRIMMMNQKKASKIRLIKYVIVLPVTGFLLLAGNARTVAEVTQEVVGQIVPAAPDRKPTGVTAQETTGLRVTLKPDVVLKTGDSTVTGVRKETVSVTKIGIENVPLSLDQVVVTGFYTGSDKKKLTVVNSGIDEMPRFPGGEKEAGRFLARHLKYPQYAAEKGIQGTVVVAFIVDKNGEVSETEVITGVDGSLDAEAVRVVKSMPKWIPGKKAGVAVDVQCSMPITFHLVQKTEEGTYTTVTATGNRSDLAETKVLVRGVKANAAQVENTKVVKRDSNRRTYFVQTQGTNASGENVSFLISSTEGKNQSALSPALYLGALSQIDLNNQIVILNDRLVEDVKELPQELSKVEEILLVRKEDTVRKMNKKYGKQANSVLIVKTK